MQVDDKIFELISELEYIIGNETYSKSTLCGPYTPMEDFYRYPVRMKMNNNEQGRGTKIQGKVHNHINFWTEKGVKRSQMLSTPDIISSMYYPFGPFELYIGNGLVKVLEFLEQRYGIDFNELEQNAHKK